MDLQLLQALDATRRMAAQHGARWDEVGARAQRILDHFGADGGDPLGTPFGHNRIKRRVLDPDLVRTAKAAMFALSDRDSDEVLAATNDALKALEDEVSAKPARRWRHRKDVVGRGAA